MRHVCVWVMFLGAVGLAQAQTTDLAEQNEVLFGQLKKVHALTDSQMTLLRGMFKQSGYMGQGNPAVTQHPMTPDECREKVQAAHAEYLNPEFEHICGDKYMAPLYDPATQKPGDATACIDQFEFPNIPCTYPVVWVRTREAAEICSAVGKRLCDAHEWEGACAGRLEAPGYRFDLAVGQSPSVAIRLMRDAHNRAKAGSKSWCYGPEFQKGICAANSFKAADCTGGDWKKCGSNTYPTGSFPDCRSTLGVYDLNGNAAEHMNLPLNEGQMASKGSKELGYTEMKGSWFIWDKFRAHEDWCRWRAPFWHGSRVMDKDSHHNYHLGFRCCKTLDGVKKL